MFVNYFKRPNAESTAATIFLCRVLFCCYAIWKLSSFDFSELQHWPQFLFANHGHQWFIPFTQYLSYIHYELAFAIACLFLVMIGYQLGLSSFLASLTIAHLTAVHYIISNASCTFIFPMHILLFISIFRKYDLLTIDKYLKSDEESLPSFFKNNRSKLTQNHLVKYASLLLAGIYFLTGFGKLYTSGVAWLYPSSLIKLVQFEVLMHLGEINPFASMLTQAPILSGISTIITIFIEVGFLFALVLRKNITPFIFLFAGLHLIIFLSMQIFFFDQYILFLLLLDWDKLFRKSRSQLVQTMNS
ncbi:hypothetical protein SCG7109_AR_00100 [Chlamydiales bacterium SCGC AG-110-M15]|nr:hypothetical protein SCG7109_AR_00100 [Chlamydiales bacterium SCGC AG-110-M15]